MLCRELIFVLRCDIRTFVCASQPVTSDVFATETQTPHGGSGHSVERLLEGW